MNKPTQYEPTPQDAAWARWIVTLMPLEGRGYVHYPNSGLVYRVVRERGLLELQNSYKLRFMEQRVMHDRTVAIFNSIGWMVTPPSQYMQQVASAA